MACSATGPLVSRTSFLKFADVHCLATAAKLSVRPRFEITLVLDDEMQVPLSPAPHMELQAAGQDESGQSRAVTDEFVFPRRLFD